MTTVDEADMLASATYASKRFPGAMPAPTEWSAAAEYAVTLHDPLVSATTRTEATASITQLCVRYPVWACVWFGGSTATILATLPGADPWLSKHPLVTPSVVQQARTTSTPRFGSYLDAIDLGAPISDDLRSDIGLAAFAEPLSDDSAHVLSAASDAASTAVSVLADRTAPDGEMVFLTGHDALRWAIARRRQYLGHDDLFQVRALFKWGWSAARIATGRSFNGDELEQFIEDEALPDDLYLPEV
jgi:hypothetical protein